MLRLSSVFPEKVLSWRPYIINQTRLKDAGSIPDVAWKNTIFPIFSSQTPQKTERAWNPLPSRLAESEPDTETVDGVCQVEEPHDHHQFGMRITVGDTY